jgi:predicted nuclease of predicted toxin-antitoxin system
MNFKTDENLPVEVAELLRQLGHDALSVGEQQLAGHPDTDVAAICQSEQRALVTLDLDFADVRAYPPAAYSGLVVLRPRLQTVSAIGRLAEQMVRCLDAEPLAGRLWIVEEQRVRIREGGASGSP